MVISEEYRRTTSGSPLGPGSTECPTQIDGLTPSASHSSSSERYPHRNEDEPFWPHIVLASPNDTFDRFGIQPNNAKQTAPVSALMANLAQPHIARSARWIFYSRDRSHYSDPVTRQYRPPHYTYKSVLDAVQLLETSGLIEHERTSPSPNTIYRSRLRLTSEFAAELAHQQLNVIHHDRPPIVLRDENKRLKSFKQSKRL